MAASSPSQWRTQQATTLLGALFAASLCAAAQLPQTRTITSSALAIDATTNRAFAVDEGNDRVVVLDLTTGQRAFWKTGSAPDALALDAAARRLFVVNAGSGTVSVLDATTGQTLAQSTTDRRPYTLGLDRKLHRVYVSNTFSNELTAIDAQTNAATRLPLGSKDAIVVDEARGRVFLSSYEDPAILMLDESNGKTTRLPAAVHTWALAVVPTNGHLIAAIIGSDALLDINPASSNATRIPVGAMPAAIALSGSNTYVVNRESNTVSLVDLTAARIERTIPVGRRPGAISTSDHLVWVANTAGSSVTVWNEACPARTAELPTPSAPYGILALGKGKAVVAEFGSTVADTVTAPGWMENCRQPTSKGTAQ